MFGLCDVLGSQELLGTGAARSALSVVVPFDIDGHTSPSLLLPTPMLICVHWVPSELLGSALFGAVIHAVESFLFAGLPTTR
jgi:hypothetical protein